MFIIVYLRFMNLCGFNTRNLLGDDYDVAAKVGKVLKLT